MLQYLGLTVAILSAVGTVALLILRFERRGPMTRLAIRSFGGFGLVLVLMLGLWEACNQAGDFNALAVAGSDAGPRVLVGKFNATKTGTRERWTSLDIRSGRRVATAYCNMPWHWGWNDLRCDVGQPVAAKGLLGDPVVVSPATLAADHRPTAAQIDRVLAVGRYRGWSSYVDLPTAPLHQPFSSPSHAFWRLTKTAGLERLDLSDGSGQWRAVDAHYPHPHVVHGTADWVVLASRDDDYRVQLVSLDSSGAVRWSVGGKSLGVSRGVYGGALLASGDLIISFGGVRSGATWIDHLLDNDYAIIARVSPAHGKVVWHSAF